MSAPIAGGGVEGGAVIGGVRDLEIRGIDGTQAGVVDLCQTRPTYFVPIMVLVGLRSVSGFTSVPTMSVGVTGPNYNDIIPATPATGINAVGKYAVVQLTGIKQVLPPNSTIKLNITVPAVATEYKLDVHIIGVYV